MGSGTGFNRVSATESHPAGEGHFPANSPAMLSNRCPPNDNPTTVNTVSVTV